MNPSSTDFSLHALEARFEMQICQLEAADSGGGGGGCGDTGGGGGGGDYGYYGGSWDNLGAGGGYVGTYQAAEDGSGAMLDDGSYTDGSGGGFPTYNQPPDICRTQPNFPGCPPPNSSRCTICRC
jgi:hypothetical protein